MRYLTLMADYMNMCIKDEFEGFVSPESLDVPDWIIEKIILWNAEYKKIIPMSIQEREAISEYINELDHKGIELAKELSTNITDSVKVKYYSEGKLTHIFY